MSRAALLPHPADPFMFHYWLKFFNEVWGDEVDRLYIYINSPMEKPVIDYMLSLCAKNPKIHVQYNNVQTEHGYALDRLLDVVTEDNVMLIEDDGFIFKRGFVDKFFTLLEQGRYDIIGSPRGSCSQEILQAAKDKWDLDYSGYGDKGCNFWPCYLFTKKELLLKTDRNFGARAWVQGEVIEPLGHVVKDPVCPSDTFGNTSLQLRGLVSKDRILEIPQYHGSPNDSDDYSEQKNLFDGLAWWTHIGSLSSGTHGVLVDDFGRPLGRRSIDPPKESFTLPNKPTTEGEIKEWERRVQWWLTFWKHHEAGQIIEFADAYLKAIDRIITQFGLSVTRIEKRQLIYKTLGL